MKNKIPTLRLIVIFLLAIQVNIFSQDALQVKNLSCAKDEKYKGFPLLPKNKKPPRVKFRGFAKQPIRKRLASKLKKLVEAYVKKNPVTGITVGIGQQNRRIWTHTLGFADTKKKIPATKKSRFPINDITTQLTYTIFYNFLDEGKLSLKQQFSSWQPLLPNAKDITLKHLIENTSGIDDYTLRPSYVSEFAFPLGQILHETMLGTLLFCPGTNYYYSFTNYIFLTSIIEKIERQPLSRIIAKYIQKKLKLNMVVVELPSNYKNKTLVKPHTLDGYPEIVDYTTHRGVANVFMKANELIEFFHSYIAGKLVSKRAKKFIHSRYYPTSNVGVYMNRGGMMLFDYKMGPFKGKKLIGFLGSLEHSNSFVGYDYKNKVYISVMTNQSYDIKPLINLLLDTYKKYK